MPRQYERRGMTVAEWVEENSIPEPNSGCLLWLGTISTKGYARITQNGKQRIGSRVVYEDAHGPLPDDILVCHKCDVRICLELTHLFPGTAGANTQDMLAKGRHWTTHGTLRSNAVLRDEDVTRILSDTRSTNAVAREFGVDKGTVSKIRRGINWKHIPRALIAKHAAKP